MNNRELVITSLLHKQPNKVPYHVSFAHIARANMAKYYGDSEFESKLNNCFLWLETQAPNSWKEVQSNIWVDEFGCEWNRTVDKDIGNVQNCLITSEIVNNIFL